METQVNGVRQRRDKKGTEFGEAHRDLPAFCGFTDIDMSTCVMAGELRNGVEQEQGTFVEYRKLNSRFVAIFELKQANSNDLKEGLEVRYGGTTWAQYIMCQRLKCRFFIVSVNGTKKSPPFVFYEVLPDGLKTRVTVRGTLDFTEENRMQNTVDFWKKIGLLTDTEVQAYLIEMNNFKKADVDYFEACINVNCDKHGIHEHMMFEKFLTLKEAEAKYDEYINSYRGKITKPTICSLRSFKGDTSTIIKNERL